ncbi:MAG: Glycolate dehydrogenase, iron-sulfur subunit GlcF, partial [uncultured Solirubrobacteraceae bacterium]
GRGRRVVRALRLLPADLPHLRDDGRGDGLPARAHLPHEGGAGGPARARDRPSLHRQLPGLPGLPDRLPVRCRLRRPDHPVQGLRRAAPRACADGPRAARDDAAHAAVPAALPGGGAARPARPAAGRPAARAAGGDAAPAARPAPQGGAVAGGPPRRGRAPRARGAAGRLRPAGARAGHQLGDAARARAQRRGDRHPARSGVLRGPGHAHRGGRPGQADGPAQPRGLRRGGRHRHQRRGLRLGHEGIRAAVQGRAGARRGAGLRRSRRRRERLPRRARAPAGARGARAAGQGRLPRRLPPGPRPGSPQPAARAASSRRRDRAGRARGVGAVLRLGGHVQRGAPGHRRGAGGAQGAQPARDECRADRHRQHRVHHADPDPSGRARARRPGAAHRAGTRPCLRRDPHTCIRV